MATQTLTLRDIIMDEEQRSALLTLDDIIMQPQRAAEKDEPLIPRVLKEFKAGVRRGVWSTVYNTLGFTSMLPFTDPNLPKETGAYLRTLPQGQSLEDIEGFQDALAWLTSVSGEQLPNVLAIIGGALKGGMGGAGLVSYMLNAGETYNNLRERGVSPTPASIAAGLTGAGKTAMDMFVPLRLLGKLKFAPIEKILANKLLSRTVFSVPGAEAGTETTQELMDIVTETFFGVNDPENNVARVLNAAAAGAVTSGVYGAAFKFIDPKPNSIPTKLETPPDKALVAEPTPPPEPEPLPPDPVVKYSWKGLHEALGLPDYAPIQPLIDLGLVEQVGEGEFTISDDLKRLPDGRLAIVKDGADVIVNPEEPTTVKIEGQDVPLSEVKAETPKEAVADPNAAEVKIAYSETLPSVAPGLHLSTELMLSEKGKQVLEGVKQKIEAKELILVDPKEMSIDGVILPKQEFQAIKRFMAYASEYGTKPVKSNIVFTRGLPSNYTQEYTDDLIDIDTAGESINGVAEVVFVSDGKYIGRASYTFNPESMKYGIMPSSIRVHIPPHEITPEGVPSTKVLSHLNKVLRSELTIKRVADGMEALKGMWEKSEEGILDFNEYLGQIPESRVVAVGRAAKSAPGSIAELMQKSLFNIRMSVVQAFEAAKSLEGLSDRVRAALNKVDTLGIMLSENFLGIALEHPETHRMRLFVNPFFLKEETGEQFAARVYSTFMHELAHAVEPTHSQQFTMFYDTIVEELLPGYAKFVESLKLSGLVDEVGNLRREKYGAIQDYLQTLIGRSANPERPPTIMLSAKRADIVGRLFDRYRKNPSDEETRRALQAHLARNPAIILDLMNNPQFAEWAKSTIADLPEEPVVYRAAVHGSGNVAIETYATLEAAKGAPFKKIFHTDLATAFETLRTKGQAWVKINKYYYLLKKEEDGETVTIRAMGKRIVGQGTQADVERRIREEIAAIKKVFDENKDKVTAYKLRKDDVYVRVGDMLVVRQTPEIAADLVLNAIKPKLALGKEPGADKAQRTAAFAARAQKAMEYWSEAARENGVDSINRFLGKAARLMTLVQIADRMPKFKPMQDYLGHVRDYWRTKMTVLEEAHDVLEDWIKLGYKQGQILGEVLQEVSRESFKNKALVPEERVREIIKNKGGDPEIIYPMWARVDQQFRKAAQEMYDAIVEEQKRVFGEDIAEALLKKYDQLKLAVENRNYFPETRFGRWGVSVKNQKGELVSFEAFIRKSEMKARIKEWKKKDPTLIVQSRYLSDSEVSVLQFPPALVDYLASHMELTSEQIRKLKEIQQALSPAKSFSRHMMERSQVPGASKDATAAFADYFQHFSNHLARLKHRYFLEKDILKMLEFSRHIELGAELGEVVDVIQRHLLDLLNPSNDLASLRGGIFLYMFSFLPAAALINLTQVPVYAYPYLAKQVGDAKAVKNLTKAATKLLASTKEGPKALSEWELKMLDRGTKDGFIEESFLSTIGQFATKSYLSSFWEKAPYFGYYFHRLGHFSVALFHNAEVYNRKVTFLAALETAKDLGIKSEEEIYQFARRAVDMTQFEYAYYNRPEIFRGGKGLAQIKPTIGVFKMFLQNHLYFAFTNQGGWRFWLVLAMMVGLKGAIPFGEEVEEALSTILSLSKKKLGLPNPKVDLELQARKFIQSVGANPDLFMHGMARYSFGLAPLANLFGLPFPAVDFSNMMSMQEILPFIKPILQSLRGEKDPTDAISDAFFRTMGAVFSTSVGAGASLLYALRGDMEGIGPVRMYPRAVQAFIKAWRAYHGGAYIGSNGEPLARVDVRDPVHFAELVAQALGGTPTRVTQSIAGRVAVREHIAFYENWKEEITREMAMGIVLKDEGLRAQALQEFRKFQKAAPPEMRFTADGFRQAVKERIVHKNAALLGLPPQKKYFRLFKETLDLYQGQPPAIQ